MTKTIVKNQVIMAGCDSLSQLSEFVKKTPKVLKSWSVQYPELWNVLLIGLKVFNYELEKNSSYDEKDKISVGNNEIVKACKRSISTVRRWKEKKNNLWFVLALGTQELNKY